MKIFLDINLQRGPDGGYIATCDELPNLKVVGATIVETLDKAHVAAWKLTEDNNTPISKRAVRLRIPQTPDANKYIPEQRGYDSSNIELYKLIPLYQWFCDSCGLAIEMPQEGWFEWFVERDTDIQTGFKIVHHNGKCQRNGMELYRQGLSLKDLNLTDILGDDGLGFLLDMIFESTQGSRKLKDVNEVLEIIRRVSIPYWEVARFYWEQARGAGYSPLYTESHLKAIIREFSE